MELKYYFDLITQEVKMLPQLLQYLFSLKKKAIYVGCTRMGNLGDEAIFEALKKYTKDQLVTYEIPYNKPKAGRLLRKWLIKNPEYIILGGGTIVKKSKEESYLKIIKDQMALYPQAKRLVLGPGVADEKFAASFGFPINRGDWKSFLDTCSFVSVRGILSKAQLEEWEVAQPIEIFHDPAVCFARNKCKKKNKTKTIALNFAYIGNKIYGENPEQIEKFANALTERLLQEHWTVYLYPTTKSDLHYMMETIGLKKHQEIKVYENYTDIDKSLDFLESMDVFLGQRLHSIIFAANVSTPFHAIEYEPKTSDFLLTTGFENYATRTDQLDSEEAYKIVTKLYENIDFEQQKIFDLIQKVKNKQEICVQQLVSKL